MKNRNRFFKSFTAFLMAFCMVVPNNAITFADDENASEPVEEIQEEAADETSEPQEEVIQEEGPVSEEALPEPTEEKEIVTETEEETAEEETVPDEEEIISEETEESEEAYEAPAEEQSFDDSEEEITEEKVIEETADVTEETALAAEAPLTSFANITGVSVESQGVDLSNLDRNASFDIRVKYAIPDENVSTAKGTQVWTYDLNGLIDASSIKAFGDVTGTDHPIMLSGTQVGYYTVTNGVVELHITRPEGIPSSKVNGYFTLGMDLDASDDKAGKEETFNFPGGASLGPVKYKDNNYYTSKSINGSQTKDGAEMELEEDDNGNFIAKYYLTFSSDVDLSTLNLEDTLGEGQTFNNDMVVYYQDSAGNKYPVSNTGSGQTIQADIAGTLRSNGALNDQGKVGKNRTVCIEYTTTIPKDNAGKLINNSAKWKLDGGNEKPGGDTSFKPKKSMSVKKTGTESGEGEDKTYTYTVTLGSKSTNMRGHTIEDVMTDIQIFQGTSVEIKDASNNTVATVNVNSEATDDNYSTSEIKLFEYTFPDDKDYFGPFTVTYQTKIAAEADLKGWQNVKNTVNDKTTGDKGEKSFSYNYGAGPTGAKIDKSWESFDEEQKLVWWTITVDKTEKGEWPLKNVSVTDNETREKVNGNQQSMTPRWDLATFKVNGQEVTPSKYIDGGNNETTADKAVTVFFESLEGPLEVTFATESKDEIVNGFYAFNKATLFLDGQYTADATAEKTLNTSEMSMDKSAYYDKNNDEYVWTVTINPDKAIVEPDVVPVYFDDTIPEGMELVTGQNWQDWDGSANVPVIHVFLNNANAISEDGSTGGYVSVRVGNTTTIHANITQDQYIWNPTTQQNDKVQSGLSNNTYVIQYKTRVKDGVKPSLNNQEISYTNVSDVTDEGGTSYGHAEETVVEKYKFIQKNDVSAHDLPTDIIRYEVICNPDEQDLSDDDFVTMTDTLKTDVELVTNSDHSVKVYDKDGNPVTDSVISYRDDTRTLTVKLPDGVYRKIEFEVQAKKLGTFTFSNTANLTGREVYSDSTQDEHKITRHSAGIEGEENTIYLKKIDEFSITTTIEGAVFRLYRCKYGDDMVMTGADDLGTFTSDGSGLVTFNKLDRFHVYYWIEESTPAPYMIGDNANPHYFVMYHDDADFEKAKEVDNSFQDANPGTIVNTTQDQFIWTATNVKDSKAHVTVEGTKNLTGDSIDEGEFKFNIERVTENAPLPENTTAETVASTEEGDDTSAKFTFDDIEFDTAGTYTYLISEDTSEKEENVVYDESVYKVVVSVKRDEQTGDLVVEDGYPVITKYASREDYTNDKDGAAVTEITFANEKKTFGSLKITKTVEGGDAEAEAKTFKVAVYTEIDDKNYYVTNAETGILSDQLTYLDIKKDETIEIKNLTPGEYHIIENEADAKVDAYTLTVDTGEPVTIEAGKESTATVANKYESEFGSLKITKTVNGDAPGAKDKTFEVEVTTKIDGKTYYVTNTDGILSDEESTLEIHDGETLEIKNLTPGQYEITELQEDAKIEGYKLTVDTGDPVTIEAAKTTDASVSNKYDREYGKLKITKKVTENSGAPVTDWVKDALAATYEFKIYTDEDCTKQYGDPITITITGDTDEGYQDTAAEVLNMPTGKYWIVETDPNNGSKADQNKIPVEVTASDTETNPETAEFANNIDTGSLKVSKTVTSSTASDKTKKFKFTVTLKGSTITGMYGEMEFTNGVAKIELADGESKTATGLPTDVEYTVEEETAAGFIVTPKDGKAEGTISKEGTEETFANTKDEGGIVVSKTVESPLESDKETEFTFTVKLSDETINSTYGEGENAVTFKNGEATFTLHHGQTRSITGLPKGITYTVTEEPNELFDTAPEKATGTVGDETANVSFTNTRKTGDLEVTKSVVSDASADQTKKFEFTVTLKDTKLNGTFGDMDFTDGVAKFELGNGGTAKAEGLPQGVEYTVEEKSVDGFTTEKSGDTGTISSEKKTAEFTNTRKTGGFEVKKTVVSDASADKTKKFTFTVTLSDNKISGKYGELTFKDGKAEVELANGETASVTGLPTGITYKVEETEAAGFTTEKSGNEGTVAETTATAEFTNTRETGNLKVSKTVTSSTASDKTKKFKFTVTLKDNTINGTYGEMKFTNGVAKIELADGESLTAEGLPTDVEYTVEEETAAGFIVTPEGGTAEGKIAKAETEVKFTNTKDEGGLIITKEVESDISADQQKAFTFKVTLGDNTISGEYGDMTFDKGSAEFTLTAGEAKSASGLPKGITYKVEETTDNLFSSKIDKPEGKIGDETVTVTAKNTRKTGDLEVTKTVESKAAADKDQKFKFTVTLKDTPLNGKYGDMEFKDGKAVFELKTGGQATAKGLPQGVEYTVTEESAEGFTTEKSGDTGTISAEKQTAGFTNTRKTGELTVSKTVESGLTADKTKEFTFIVKLSDTTIQGTYGEMNFHEGKAQFNLTDGKSLKAEGLPTGITYEVEELTADGFTTKSTGETGKISDDPAEAAFTNTRKTGDLEITKTVTSDAAADKSQTFTFTVTLTGAPITGTYGDMTFKDGAATVKLKHGDTKTATGLPVGAEYTVEEEKAAGFTTTSKGETGTISEEKSSASFANAREKGGLTVSKTVVSLTESDKTKSFSFEVKLSDNTISGTYGEMTFDKGSAKFNLTDGQSKTAEGLPTGITYEVTETEDKDFTTTSTNAKGEVTTEAVTAAFRNTKIEGSLKITKNVTKNGKTTTDVDGTYTFLVEGQDGIDYSKEVSIEIKDGKSTGDAQIDGLKPGNYKVTETDKNGLDLVSEDGVIVEVKADSINSPATVVFTNNKSEFKTDKVEAGSAEEIDGAVISIYDSEGNKLDSWESKKGETHDFGSVLKPGNTYTLKEDGAPAGFDYLNEITIDISDKGAVTVSGDGFTYDESTGVYKLEDESLKFEVNKTTAGGEEVEGAVITVYDDKGNMVDRWTSKKGETHDFGSKLEAGNTYKLREDGAPAGYGYVNEITVEVAKDGTVTAESEDLKYNEETGVYELIDEEIKFNVNKTAAGSGEEVEGAVITVYDENDKVVDTWTSKKGETHDFGSKLEAGKTYKLVEDGAPAGYGYVNEITVEVAKDGTVKAESDNLKYNEETGVYELIDEEIKFNVNKTTAGGEEVEGAVITVYDEDGKEVDSWTSKEGETHDFGDKLEAGKTYKLVEDGAPAGYGYINEIEVTIEKDGSVTVESDDLVYNEETGVYDILDEEIKFNVDKTTVGGEEVEGAIITVYDEDGNVVDSWTSKKGETHDFGEKLEAGKTYTLKEDGAPAGYAYANEVTVKVAKDGSVTFEGEDLVYDEKEEVYRLIDEEIKFEVNKKSAGNGEEVEGAVITVYDENGKEVDSWTSKKGETHDFGEKLEAGKTYKLVEDGAPAGYAYANEVTVKVAKDGSVTFEGEDLVYDEKEEVYRLIDEEIKFEVNKKSAGNGEEVEGAVITVYDENGKEVDSWTSKEGETHDFGDKLEAGKTYKLVEDGAPAGYGYINEIEVTIGKDGSVTVESDDLVYNEETGVYDILDEEIKFNVDKTTAGGEEVEGAVITIYDENGKEVDSWTSTKGETHDFGEKLEAGKTYILKEDGAPAGYAYANEVTVKVAKDGSVTFEGEDLVYDEKEEVYRLIDEEIKFEVNKKSAGNGEEVEGAVITVYDEEGKVVDSWVSEKDKTHDFGSKLEAGKTYKLVEDGAPAGYGYINEIEVTIEKDGSVTVESDDLVYNEETGVYDILDEEIKFNVNKTAAGSGEEVEGAVITVYDEDNNVVDSWTSKKGETHDFGDKLEAGKTYKLVEDGAPAGYGYVNEITVEVAKDGTVTAESDDLVYNEEKEVYELIDEEIKFEVNKKSAGNGEEVEGAVITVYDEDGKVVDSWTSKKGETHDFGEKLEAGKTYKLVEDGAPAGYAYINEITVTVEKDGTVTVESEDLVYNEETGVYDILDEEIHFNVNKTDAGTGEEVEGAVITVYDEDGKVVDSWTSKKGETHDFGDKLEAGKTYRLVEDGAPAGYAYANEITIKVAKDGTVTFEGESLKWDEETQSYVIEDEQLKLTLRKVDESGKALSGAKFNLIDTTTGRTVHTFTTAGKDIDLSGYVLAGHSYKLVETEAPNGYTKAIDTKIEIAKDGSVKVNGKDQKDGVVKVTDKKLSGGPSRTPKKSVNTGDPANTVLWGMSGLASLLIAVWTFLKKRKYA